MAIVTTHVAAVQQLYVAYFGRPADTAGLDYWTNVVETNKGSTTQVSANFALSTEYTAAFAGMSNGQIVDKIYMNLFGRAADTAGRDYWVGLLDAGSLKVSTIVADVANGAVTTDKEIIENKVAGATAFTTALDLPAEQAGYTGPAALALAKAFLVGITTDASLATAITPATLNTTVSGVVAAGTPFTLSAGLSTLQAATSAKTAFLDAADGKTDGVVAAGTEAKVKTGDVTAAAASVETSGGVAGYQAAATANLRAALVADKVAANNAALTTAQNNITSANAEIAKVAGLTAAVATLTAATTAKTAADKALVTVSADLAAKVASYNVLNTTDINTTVPADGVIASLTAKNAAGTAIVAAANVTETTNPGVTALIASINAKLAADVSVANSIKSVNSAQASVDYLDMGTTEAAALEVIKGLLPTGTVAAGSLPTQAQIATQKAILEANAAAPGAPADAATKLTTFNNAVDDYNDVSIQNARVDALGTATTAATAANKAIADLTKATTALTKAEGASAQLAGFDASIDAAKKAFVDAGLVAPQDATTGLIATAASDIYVAGKVDASINLFGLLGNDALFIGTGYTLNTTATMNATTNVITGGNDGVLEAFIFNGTDGAHIVLEKSVFGSAAATPEVVTITLVGVDATDVQLNNGIITTV
jgi:hypothetical protein